MSNINLCSFDFEKAFEVFKKDIFIFSNEYLILVLLEFQA